MLNMQRILKSGTPSCDGSSVGWERGGLTACWLRDPNELLFGSLLPFCLILIQRFISKSARVSKTNQKASPLRSLRDSYQCAAEKLFSACLVSEKKHVLTGSHVEINSETEQLKRHQRMPYQGQVPLKSPGIRSYTPCPPGAWPPGACPLGPMSLKTGLVSSGM